MKAGFRWSLIVGIIIIILIFYNNLGDNIIINEESNDNIDREFNQILLEIERGNKYILENKLIKDNCFPYRYHSRGCYYDGKLKFNEGNIISSFSNNNLSSKQKIELCYKFVFKGSIAFCLNKNNEVDKCKEISSKDEYLSRICNLKNEETIPESPANSDPEYREDPIPLVKLNDYLY